jgi:hypothetical protein
MSYGQGLVMETEIGEELMQALIHYRCLLRCAGFGECFNIAFVNMLREL